MVHDAAVNGEKGGAGWLEASGLPHILRTFGLAVQPTKLCIALVAIALTFLLGVTLDAVWKAASCGVEADAVSRLMVAQELGQTFSETVGEHGLFDVWESHQRRCVSGLLGSSIPAISIAARTSLGTYVEAHATTSPLDNIANMVLGVWWLLRYHTLYFLVFGFGSLLIWSLAGGAICRIAALQFAQDEAPAFSEALAFSRKRLFSGFFLAPCFPLCVIALTMIAMFMGGLVMGIPFLGDLLGGLAFSLAILGGFFITLLLVGLLAGGSLFWPAVAVEGSDAFDAFSRSLAYTLTKPWKAVLYAAFAIVFAAICWLVVNVFTFFTLTFTRIVVGFGTAPFGWWGRGAEGDLPSKLERVWPMAGPDTLYVSPPWGELSANEYISAALVAVHVLVVVGLVWAFLASFYFTGCTILYYLLRRDVDAVDLEDVYIEEDELDVSATDEPPAPTGSGSHTDVKQSVEDGVSKGDDSGTHKKDGAGGAGSEE